MARSIDEILAHPLITVEDRHDEMGSFAIKLGSLQTMVFIELGRFRHGQTTKFHQSHVIHTPVQADPYRTSRAFSDSWEDALEDVLRTLTSYYEEAVRKGHKPQESWLVKY